MADRASDSVIEAAQRAFQACAGVAQEPAWLARRRANAMQHFVNIGLPTRGAEAWRFTDLRPLLTGGGLPTPAPDASADPQQLAAHRLPGMAHRIVLLNGRVVPELSQIGTLPPGAWLGSLADAIEQRPDLAEAACEADEPLDEQPFASLNAAFCADGFVLALEPGVVLQHPVEVLYYTDAPTARAYHMRSVVLAAPGSGATVIETYIGTGSGWTNAVTSVDVGADATLHHAKVQAESAQATHLALTRARLAQAARYDSFILVAGARLSRHDIQVAMTGEAANLVINGAYLLNGDQEATIAPVVDHQARDGQTSELLKGVLADHAHGVFLGTVMVREGADGTDARQLNRNLMMSPTARIDTKPELTIHADEVKCSHGATVGDLDEAALFYLQARGIDPLTARHMLIAAFAAEVFDVAALAPDLDAHARRYLDAWLDRDGPHV